MPKLYSIFEKLFGWLYHPFVRCFRFNRYVFSDFVEIFLINFFNHIGVDLKRSSSKKRIFYDMTAISKDQRFAGISRVVLKIREKLSEVQSEYDIVEVFAKQHAGYFELSSGKKIRPALGDIFFCAEACEGVVNTNGRYFSILKKHGIKTYFFLHDLIPLRFPHYMGSKNFIKFYKKYVSVISLSDGIICNSKSVLDDFERYLSESRIRQNPKLKKSFTHLGVDFKTVPLAASKGEKNSQTVFLMVSTVEARKKYDQAVEAFNLLWKKGIDVRLNIVGKYGWNAEKAKKLIEENPELNNRLFWYNTGISDEELSSLYQQSDCLIFASMAEGFGLSLVEASFYKKPLILRDIPIFREIAGNSAYYFDSERPEVLAVTIQEWLSLYADGRAPASDGIRYISWEECASNVFSFIRG